MYKRERCTCDTRAYFHGNVQLHACNCSCFKARQDYILESRRIREEQDREYQESLRIDQEKEEKRQNVKADLERKEQVNCA